MNTINQAIAEANRNTRAQNMKAEGYYLQTGDWNKVEIFKPGNAGLLPDYTVNRTEATCTCKDFEKTNKTCKHQMFVELEAEKYPQAQEVMEEAKMWEAICAEYDARARYEE